MKGLYIHIPFCKSKCKYCGFFSECKDEEVISAYINALKNELKLYEDDKFDTIYIGGGTPSLLKPELLYDLLEYLYKLNGDNAVESTMEVNPDSVNSEQLEILKTFNFNRISIGIQSLDDDVLKFLGRVHTAKKGFDAIEMVMRIGGFSINCDIIYDIPTIPYDKISYTLNKLTELPIDHISAYNYSFDTDFLKEDYDAESYFYEVKDYIESKSFMQYEISNFAIEGFESKHNINYWMMGEYIGVGVASHSMYYDDCLRVRSAHREGIDEYIKDCYDIEKQFITQYEQPIEDIVFGLRMIKGVDMTGISKRYDLDISMIMDRCYQLFDENFLEVRGDRLCLTRKGQLYLDYVQQYLWDRFTS